MINNTIKMGDIIHINAILNWDNVTLIFFLVKNEAKFWQDSLSNNLIVPIVILKYFNLHNYDENPSKIEPILCLSIWKSPKFACFTLPSRIADNRDNKLIQHT